MMLNNRLAVIYARFSSSSQREESIEGQLKACYDYAKREGYSVVGEYIDRALSGTDAEHRPDFQRMIGNSNEKLFSYVLVYQFDRFARNRYDSALYKRRLRDNGVQVISVKENVGNDPSGVMLEGILETLAEYYSADLALKIRRGQATNSEHCRFNGGSIPLGYRVNSDRKFEIDPSTAPLIKRVFEEVAEGRSMKELIAELNSEGFRNARGRPFNKNSFKRILRNRRYMGIYIFGDAIVPGGMPQIVQEDLFEKVQNRLDSRQHEADIQTDYMLTGKLFCGYCHDMMVGVSGTSVTGRTYRYYVCRNARKGACDKKSVRKELVEDFILEECRRQLTAERITEIAVEVARLVQKDLGENTHLRCLEKQLEQVKRKIANLLDALETGAEADFILERIRERRDEKNALEVEIAKEKANRPTLDEDAILFFLDELREGNIRSKKYRTMLFNVFVNQVYLYEDRAVLFFNAGKQEIEITKQLREDVEGILENDSSTEGASAPPEVTGR